MLRNAREYAKGFLTELEASAEGISCFLDAYSGVDHLFTPEEWGALGTACEKAEGFTHGFRACLELWPAPAEGKEDAHD